MSDLQSSLFKLNQHLTNMTRSVIKKPSSSFPSHYKPVIIQCEINHKPLSLKVYCKGKEKQQITEGPCCKGQFGLKSMALMPSEFQGRSLEPALFS